MSTKRSFLEKYDIPISHLDYKYIDDCYNPKEMEKIVIILRSGQEGHFPDLTRHAEERLRALNSVSKVFRTEVPLLSKNHLESSERQELETQIAEWIGDIREKDRTLFNVAQEQKAPDLTAPPVRKGTQIDPSNPISDSSNKLEPKPKPNRIKSIEYNKWDKYDADTEILKIELEEEKAKEEIARKNRINLKKSAEVESASIQNKDVDKLTEVEKEHLALWFKDRGNDFFRTKDYKEALHEYTKCIQVKPTVNGFNNRSLVYLKLNDFAKCIEDSESCLEIDPENVKARHRKALGYIGLHKYIEAYNTYKEILNIDPENATAKNQLKELEKQLPDGPPDSATRIRITEEESNPSTTKKSLITKDSTNQKINSLEDGKKSLPSSLKVQSKTTDTKLHKPKTDKQRKDEEDLSKLIMPNKVVKSKLKTAVEAIGSIQKQTKTELQAIAKQKTRKNSDVKISLDTLTHDCSKKSGLIVEM